MFVQQLDESGVIAIKQLGDIGWRVDQPGKLKIGDERVEVERTPDR